MANEAIDKLKYEHEDAIINVGDEGWNEATDDLGLDKISRAGYDLDLDSVGIPDDRELYDRTILCPPGAFTVAVVNPGQAHVADEENTNVGNDPRQ